MSAYNLQKTFNPRITSPAVLSSKTLLTILCISIHYNQIHHYWFSSSDNCRMFVRTPVSAWARTGHKINQARLTVLVRNFFIVIFLVNQAIWSPARHSPGIQSFLPRKHRSGPGFRYPLSVGQMSRTIPLLGPVPPHCRKTGDCLFV